MSIEAKIIADSVSGSGIRLTTMQVRYPRFIHGEVMTHRMFSRNASSSRAIPVKKVIQDVLDDPAMPLHWGKNQPGMQANEEHTGLVDLAGIQLTSEQAWLEARDQAVRVARAFEAAGYHKQIVNRLLEPFMHMNVCITSTHWSNFYALRRHPDAQPEIKVLADVMYEAHQASTPTVLERSQWHLPYVRQSDRDAAEIAVRSGMPIKKLTNMVTNFVDELLIRVSVARCARTSYHLHDGAETTFEADVALYDRLLSSEPLHASPAEHVAKPDFKYDGVNWDHPMYHGNLTGWIQYRKLLKGECQ